MGNDVVKAEKASPLLPFADTSFGILVEEFVVPEPKRKKYLLQSYLN